MEAPKKKAEKPKAEEDPVPYQEYLNRGSTEELVEDISNPRGEVGGEECDPATWRAYLLSLPTAAEKEIANLRKGELPHTGLSEISNIES